MWVNNIVYFLSVSVLQLCLFMSIFHPLNPLRSQYLHEWQCHILWGMPSDTPQLRLVRTRGMATSDAFFSGLFPPVNTFQCFGWVWVIGGKWSFIPQDFGRGRTLTSRCDFIQNLQKRGCEARYIENPTSGISILQNLPLSYKGSSLARFDVVQIMPQMISLSLRPGEYS